MISIDSGLLVVLAVLVFCGWMVWLLERPKNCPTCRREPMYWFDDYDNDDDDRKKD